MDTKLKAKLEQAKEDKRLQGIVADKEIAHIEHLIAAEAKPELRHGDVKLYEGYPHDPIVFLLDADLKTVCFNRTQQMEPDGTVERRSKEQPTECNIYDLIDEAKAMQETVTEFEIQCHNAIITNGTVKVGQAIDPSNLAFICLRSESGNSVSIHMTAKEFDHFTKKCQQKNATIKRNQSNKK